MLNLFYPMSEGPSWKYFEMNLEESKPFSYLEEQGEKKTHGESLCYKGNPKGRLCAGEGDQRPKQKLEIASV